MKPNYRILSNVYGLLDAIYFNRPKTSPRTALLSAVPDTGLSVLDICAGTCSNSILIAENRPKASITALDLSAEMLKIAEKKFVKKNIANIKTIVADACNTGFLDNEFDLILISLVLHEVSEDLRTGVLSEARRLLSEDGRIIVIEWEQPTNFLQKALFAPIKLLEPRGFKAFLRTDLTAYFADKGLSVIEKIKSDYTSVIVLRKGE